jgi:hypothetical protein
VVGRHDFALNGDSVVGAGLNADLYCRGDVQKLATLEVGGKKGLDLLAECGTVAASLVQIGVTSTGVGQIQGGEKELFFGHGGSSAG